MDLYHFDLKNIDHLKDAIKCEYLGDGGCGVLEMYQCKQICNNVVCDKIFVVKTAINESKYGGLIKRKSKTKIDKIYTEYDIGILLDHRNIRKTFDIDIKRDSIIFEYCSGLDLLEYANEYHFSNTRSLTRLFGQILDAVEYLHTKGIAHLDLKLENIMYNPVNNEIKLIDFGEAVMYYDFDDVEIDFVGPRGTFQYMCPEMLACSIFSAPKADLWACGVLLYNLYYNKPLWDKAVNTDFRYRTFYLSISKNMLTHGMFPENRYYTREESQIIRGLFKILLNPDPNKRKDIHIVKSIFSLICFKDDDKKQIAYSYD